MIARTEPAWWIALLLAGAMVLHLFMLTGGPVRSPTQGTAHSAHVATPWHDVTTDGDGDPSASHTAADMLSMCFVVLSVVTAGIGSILVVRLKRTGRGLEHQLVRLGLPVDHATCGGRPSRPSRVDSGVLLRV